jgi:acetyltransferase
MSAVKPPAIRPYDPSVDVLGSERRPLDPIFRPESVALIGATERARSVGDSVLRNLIADFKGKIFPVNPQRPEVHGLKAYPSVSAIPEPVDVAIVVTPASTCPGIIRECVDAGVGGAVVISAGFKEIGAAGVELERQMMEEAHKRPDFRIIGPNCLGIMSPLIGLNATFAASNARPGTIALLSQSGALCTAILDWSLREKVGFSGFVSTGSMVDVTWGDLIYHYGDDPRTHAILIYMESVGDARAFISAAREVALTKPIIVIKAGRTAAASKAAASHTGALTGSDDVLDAAFRRCGVLRVNAISDLFYMAEALSKQPRPAGPHLAIVTNSGGPAVLATDALIANGGELAELSNETMQSLNSFLPAAWSHGNPVDILGDSGPERFAKALEIVGNDPACDGVLMVTCPQGMTAPLATANQLIPVAQKLGKPVIASFMGGPAMDEATEAFNEAGIPTFDFADTGARAFDYMWRYSYNLRWLYETPVETGDRPGELEQRQKVEAIIDGARQSGRTILTEIESKQVLAHYGIPTVDTRLARTADEAAATAKTLGFPVVLKIYSETITHKTDVGGVVLNLTSEDAVCAAFDRIQKSVTEKVGAQHFQGVTVQPMIKIEGYEVILGSSIDPQFGPVMLFGSGGQLVEVYQDRALALPPLNTTLATRLMEHTKIYQALKGVRGRKAVDLVALERLLVRFSELVVEQKWIKELDINPLIVGPTGIVALDARVVVHGPEVTPEQLLKPAIRPYPSQYVAKWTMKDGKDVVIRPIRPEDEPLMAKFHETLSPESVYMRYFHQANLRHRISHERLVRVCHCDYDRDIVLVAELAEPPNGERQVVAVGRMSKLHGRNIAEFALIVSDSHHRKGLGTELVTRLIEIARKEKLESISANVMAENREVHRLAASMGFSVKATADPMIVHTELKLN